MKLRKIGKTFSYKTVHCPDTVLESGQTTKRIRECEDCDYYKGVLNDDSGKYVRCNWLPTKGLIESRDMNTKYHVNQKTMRALNTLDIHPDEFDFGLSHVKHLATKKYKEKLFKYHPDTSKFNRDKASRMLMRYRNAFDRIDKLTLSPPTDETMDTYLDLGGEL